MFKDLLVKVFGYRGEKLLLMHDLLPYDDTDHQYRVDLVKRWAEESGATILAYDATGSNNAPLPEYGLVEGMKTSIKEKLAESGIVLALTEYSATAPLKELAQRYGFRAASMPGFNQKMLPALDIDFGLLARKVDEKYQRLKTADTAVIVFIANSKECRLVLDLKGSVPLKDDGDCRKKGTVINLPSGEAFVAPKDSTQSRTQGILPLQEGDDVVLYKVRHNQIIGADAETVLMKRIKEDPAVGNIAELGLGVLSDFGIKPCGRTLLDEKLGVHIALGRNDHFGGNIQPKSFRRKENVWHQDYVFIKEMQPKIRIKSIDFRTS
jgi:aminopeptidase